MKKTKNSLSSRNPSTLQIPDIATFEKTSLQGTLDWVGMSKIECRGTLELEKGLHLEAEMLAEAFVNLHNTEAKGIHMSRLYLALEDTLEKGPLTPKTFVDTLKKFISSHQGLSDGSYLELRFLAGLKRQALKSGLSGHRSYPVVLRGQLDQGELKLEMGVEVTYSSTCPCSAALARSIIQDQFREDFAQNKNFGFEQVLAWLGTQQGISATPHSQRSSGKIMVQVSEKARRFEIVSLIDLAEKALKTPVQTAVKRVDEQEFARLNGQNLMFCEDAARRLKAALNTKKDYLDYWLRCTHFESLHAHDAVSTATKGVKGGYKPSIEVF